MSTLNPKLPVRYKKLQHPWSVSFEFEGRSDNISYYLRMKVLEEAFKLDKAQGKAQNPADNFPVLEVMDYLEAAKKSGSVGTEEQAYQEFELKAAQLLGAAEKLDKEMRYDRKIVKLYFTASILFDSMSIFRSYDGKHADKSKFVKWRSTYIATELKAGRTPEPPAMDDVGDDELAELEAELQALDAAPGPSMPSGSNLPTAGAGMQSPSQNPQQFQQHPQQPPQHFQQHPQQPPQQSSSMRNPYPNINAYPSGPSNPSNQPMAAPRQAPKAAPIQRPSMQPARPAPAPVTQNFSAPVSGSFRKLTVAEKKNVKDMLALVSDCLTYDDSAGAVQCCQNAINFIQTGQMPK